MRATGAFLVLVAASLLIALLLPRLFWGDATQSQPPHTFTNTRLGYDVTIPSDYRVSWPITYLVNTTGRRPLSLAVASDAEYVFITKASPDIETSFIDLIDSSISARGLTRDHPDADFVLAELHYQMPPGIEIFPTDVPLTDVRQLRNFRRSSNVELPATRDGFLATFWDRYEQRWYDAFYLEFVAVQMRSGDSARTLVIKMPHSYDPEAFRAVISSFHIHSP